MYGTFWSVYILPAGNAGSTGMWRNMNADMAHTKWSPWYVVAAPPVPAVTVTPVSVCSIFVTGDCSLTRLPRCFANVSGRVWLPPVRRSIIFQQGKATPRKLRIAACQTDCNADPSTSRCVSERARRRRLGGTVRSC